LGDLLVRGGHRLGQGAGAQDFVEAVDHGIMTSFGMWFVVCRSG
jgi:hypothetical protein